MIHHKISKTEMCVNAVDVCVYSSGKWDGMPCKQCDRDESIYGALCVCAV